jgi:hypothetical protein
MAEHATGKVSGLNASGYTLFERMSSMGFSISGSAPQPLWINGWIQLLEIGISDFGMLLQMLQTAPK